MKRTLSKLRASKDTRGLMDALAVCVRSNFAGTESVKMYSEVSTDTESKPSVADRGRHLLARRVWSNITSMKLPCPSTLSARQPKSLWKRKGHSSVLSIRITDLVHCAYQVARLLATISGLPLISPSRSERTALLMKSQLWRDQSVSRFRSAPTGYHWYLRRSARRRSTMHTDK